MLVTSVISRDTAPFEFRIGREKDGPVQIGMSEFQESNSTWRRLRLQQILYKSVLDNDLDMVLKCVQHGADIREEYHPVSATCDTYEAKHLDLGIVVLLAQGCEIFSGELRQK